MTEKMPPRNDTRCMYPEQDVAKACATAIELAQRSTRVVSWYAHPAQVRGPYTRWLEISEVPEQYKHNVASREDEAKFAAFAMNNVEAIAIAHLALLQEHEESLKRARAEGEQEIKTLSHQVTECMEFMIWLKGYEYTDGPIEERLDALLHTLSVSARAPTGDGEGDKE